MGKIPKEIRVQIEDWNKAPYGTYLTKNDLKKIFENT